MYSIDRLRKKTRLAVANEFLSPTHCNDARQRPDATHLTLPALVLVISLARFYLAAEHVITPEGISQDNRDDE